MYPYNEKRITQIAFQNSSSTGLVTVMIGKHRVHAIKLFGILCKVYCWKQEKDQFYIIFRKHFNARHLPCNFCITQVF